MISLQPISAWQRILERFCPWRVREREERLRTIIQYLLQHPEEPCIIDGVLVQDGYGEGERVRPYMLDHWEANEIKLADNRFPIRGK